MKKLILLLLCIPITYAYTQVTCNHKGYYPYYNITESIHHRNCFVFEINGLDYAGYIDGFESSCYNPEKDSYFQYGYRNFNRVKMPDDVIKQLGDINVWYLSNQTNCITKYNFGAVNYHNKILKYTHYY